MRVRRVAIAALFLGLAGCGGGGGGGSSPAAPDHSLPTISTDTYPAGARIDVASQDFLPFHDGDRAVFLRTSAGNATGTVTRAVTNGPDANGNFALTESDGTNLTFTNQRLSPAALLEYDPFDAQVTAPGLYAAFPTLYDYELPFYPAGSTISHIRQGSLQADIDGDGKTDYFRAEHTQLFVGFETLSVLGHSTSVAHFSTTLRLTLVGSIDGKTSITTASEESYLASGLGLVRADRSVTSGSDGLPLQPAYRLDLQSATINGVSYVDFTGIVQLALDHRFVVYDPTRSAYYASVSSTDTDHGNRIARIDAATAAVTYSAPVGSSPNALAVSADGTALYVALDGSGEVVRLALPAMNEVARVRLPVAAFGGQLFAEQIAVVPGTNDSYVVSMFRQNSSPRYAGMALVRANVLQPRQNTDFNSSNRIGFDADPTIFYAYNDESTEFGLRRFQVVSDGVMVLNTVGAGGGFGSDLRVADGLAIVSSYVYRADASLALLGTVSGADQCVKLPGIGKIVCHSTSDLNRLAVVDATTFAPLAQPIYSGAGTRSPWRLVAGPSGQVAISEAGLLTLFTNAALR